MRRHKKLNERNPIFVPTWAEKEDDVNLMRLARDAEAKRQAEEERKRVEAEKASYRKKFAGILDKVASMDNIDAKMEFLFDKLVPQSGKADTKAGELVRAMEKIRYRDWNDGDIFYAGYGKETAGPAAEYLCMNANTAIDNDIDNIVGYELRDDEYTSALNKMAEHLVDFLIENPELLATPNDKDMLNCKPNHIFDEIVMHTFDCDFGEFTNELLDRYDRDAVDEIEGWLDDFVNQHTEEGEVSSWARDAYEIRNLDILELEEVEREWDRFAADLEDYLEGEYGDEEEEDGEEDW